MLRKNLNDRNGSAVTVRKKTGTGLSFGLNRYQLNKIFNVSFGRLCRPLDYVDCSVRLGMGALRNLGFWRLM